MHQEDKTKELFEFIFDRQMIYHKKEVLNLDAPWTSDKILHQFKFCNSYRELDRGTKYLIDIIKTKKLNEQKLFFNIVTYRIFNLDGLFENIFDGYLDPSAFNFSYYETLLDNATKRGNIFNTAYILTQMSWPHKVYRRGTKHPQFLMLLEWLADQIVNHKFIENISTLKPEEVMTKLQSIPLVGPFLAGQIMVDLTYTMLVPWGGNDFCIIGPGAQRGINILTSREPSYKECLELCKYLWENQSIYFRELHERTGKNWKAIAYKDSLNGYPYLSLMDTQHSLCEYRKYNQWANNEGKKKYYNRVLTPNISSTKDQHVHI